MLMGLTPAPVEAFPLAWIALVPLWLLLADCTLKQSVIFALIWGLAYHGLALFWITGIHPMTWLGVPWLASLAIAAFCWLFISLWGAALVIAWALGMFSLRKLKLKARSKKFLLQKGFFAPFQRVLIGVAWWCLLEAIWSSGVLWWTSLSYTQSPHNLLILQLARFSGPTTVTAAIVAVNGLIAEFIYQKVKHLRDTSPLSGREELKERAANSILAAALSLLLSSHAIGWAIYARPITQENPIKIGIVQGNIPNNIKLFTDGFQRAMQRYTSGYEALADRGVDAVLTPEGALPVFIDRLQDTPIYAAILKHKTLAWLGAYGREPDNPTALSYTNSLFTVTGQGNAVSRFDKIKLVPLGEYIPFEPIVGKFIDRLSPLEAHMIPGKTSQVFETPLGKASVGICYESAFAEHFRRQTARGGEFILTASNNAHYAKSMPAQHHAQDVMRAIENDRWAARATNTGYSGIVNPHGSTIWRSGIKTYEVHADTIYRRKTRTLYVRFGDWLLGVLIILAVLSLLGFSM
ncbi:apolipoprotein N-acyltransferase [Oscillatoria sp. FACHB-1406]|nr:apolipoprotein N-acyltransferase [Oscillatoria sp. FACHB-1406]